MNVHDIDVFLTAVTELPFKLFQYEVWSYTFEATRYISMLINTKTHFRILFSKLCLDGKLHLLRPHYLHILY